MDTPTNLALIWPWAVVLLPLPWLIAWWLTKQKQGVSSFSTKLSKGALKLPNLAGSFSSSLEPSASIKPSLATRLGWRGWLWGLLVLALMRPEWQQAEIEVTYQSRQLLLLVDISSSMQELMQGRTRLDQVKQVVRDFIQQRPKDQIGLVVFGAKAYLYVPRTLDHQLLIKQLQGLQPGMAGAGTAIGDALGVGVQNLRQAKGEPAMLLLTDGANNAGQLKPNEALAMAAATDIPTHLVVVDLDLDAELSKAIKQTGGEVFSAYSKQELAKVYQKIHQLEAETQVRYLRPAFSLAFIPLLLAFILAASQTPPFHSFLAKVSFLKARFLKSRSTHE